MSMKCFLLVSAEYLILSHYHHLHSQISSWTWTQSANEAVSQLQTHEISVIFISGRLLWEWIYQCKWLFKSAYSPIHKPGGLFSMQVNLFWEEEGWKGESWQWNKIGFYMFIDFWFYGPFHQSKLKQQELKQQKGCSKFYLNVASKNLFYNKRLGGRTN